MILFLKGFVAEARKGITLEGPRSDVHFCKALPRELVSTVTQRSQAQFVEIMTYYKVVRAVSIGWRLEIL